MRDQTLWSLVLRRSWPTLSLAAICMLLAGCVTETTKRPNDTADLPSSAEQAPNAATLHAMARILATQGRDNECEGVLNQIIRRTPDYLPAYSDLAELHMRRNRPQDAADTLSAGLSRAPGDPVLLNNLGMCCTMMGDYSRALELFNRACAEAPRNQSYLGNKAMALGMLGRYADATAIYRQILDSPEEVAHNLAVLRHAHGRLPAGLSLPAADPGTRPTTQPAERR